MLSSEQFPYVLIVTIIALHIFVMAIVVYYSCCRKKCVCRIDIQNNTIHQTNSAETSRMSAQVTLSNHTDSDSLDGSNELPVTNRASSLFRNFRIRLWGDRNAPDVAGDESEELPPPYVEQGASIGFSNAGASFNELPHLPSYDDIVDQLPSFSDNEATNPDKNDKPPTYEEVEEAMRRET